jgi:hypothetical protein
MEGEMCGESKYMGEMRNSYVILIDKPGGKRLHKRSRYR